MSRITKTVSDAQISNIRQKFQEADDNNNGFLTVEELRHFLSLVGWENPTDADAQSLMTKLSKGKSSVNFFTLMQTYDIWSAGIVHKEEDSSVKPKVAANRVAVSRSPSVSSPADAAQRKPSTLAAVGRQESAVSSRSDAPQSARTETHSAADVNEIAKLKQELEALKAQIAQQQKVNEDSHRTEQALASAKAELEQLQAQIKKQSSELSAVNGKIEDAKKSLASLEKDIEQKKKEAETAASAAAPSQPSPAPAAAEEKAATEPSDNGSKDDKKKSKKPKKKPAEAEDASDHIIALAKAASKSGLSLNGDSSGKGQEESTGDRRTERSSTIGGESPASTPKRSKSKTLEKKKEVDKASPSVRRAVTSRKLAGAESPAASPKKRRDSDLALRRQVLLPNRELPIEELNAYYAAHDAAIRKAQAFVRRWNSRGRVRRLSAVVKNFAESEHSLGMRQRNAALKEIFTTERTYSDSLKKLVDIYIQPLKKLRLLDEDEMELMFSDIEVISDITGILLEKLEERLKLWPAVQKFGDIFRDSAPLMKLYYRYIRDFTKAQTRLGDLEVKYPEFKEFLSKQNEKSGGLGLMGFLIMPVQRLPRYELLLRALLKLTETTHVDFQNLTDALDAVVHVNQYINQRKKEEELKAQIPQLLSKETQKKIKLSEAEDAEKNIRYLKITIERGRNLPAMDSNGLADPYCTIAYDGENMKTKVKKETLTPDWKEDFVLAILPNSPDAFTIAVIDYDRIGANEMMGWLEFKVADFVKTPDQSGWYPLLPPKGKSKKEKKKTDDSIAGNSAPSSPTLSHGEVFLKFNYVKEV